MPRTLRPASMIAMTDPNPDSALTTLNASERELLLLLGRGHTAKSIAALKDLTELAVNERFRSARRKTGIGSSREIARLLVAQENRDDIIGVAEAAPPVAPLPRPDASRRASPLRRWSLPMSAAALLIAAAILAQQSAVPPAETAPLPVSVEAALASQGGSQDLAVLHSAVGIGQPDPSWSEETRTGLTRIHRALPGFDRDVEFLRSTCNASLCEVIAVTRPDISGDQIVTLMNGIQSRETAEAITSLKLHPVLHSFSTSNEAPAETVFVSYWQRAS